MYQYYVFSFCLWPNVRKASATSKQQQQQNLLLSMESLFIFYFLIHLEFIWHKELCSKDSNLLPPLPRTLANCSNVFFPLIRNASSSMYICHVPIIVILWSCSFDFFFFYRNQCNLEWSNPSWVNCICCLFPCY